jgi:hypothetical protein
MFFRELKTSQVLKQLRTQISLLLGNPGLSLGHIHPPMQFVLRWSLQEIIGPQREAPHPPPVSAEIEDALSLLRD